MIDQFALAAWTCVGVLLVSILILFIETTFKEPPRNQTNYDLEDRNDVDGG